jgi:hypothetical protein
MALEVGWDRMVHLAPNLSPFHYSTGSRHHYIALLVRILRVTGGCITIVTVTQGLGTTCLPSCQITQIHTICSSVRTSCQTGAHLRFMVYLL